MLAAMTKRAQMPFSAWLPAAISAPTPVSALVHSSTLVTAGVYLLIRFNFYLLERGVRELLIWGGVLTIFISGLGANFETDIKKVIALSTLSQLGLIVIILRVGAVRLAFFHLVIHALFKSTLFMCAGVLIHSVKGGQDSRKMRGFGAGGPRLILVARVRNLALCGFPFLAGFYSKDMVVELVLCGGVNMVLGGLIVARVGLTVSYRLRFIFKRVNEVSYLDRVSGLRDLDKVVFKRVVGLAVFRVIGGFWGVWWVLGLQGGAVLGFSQKYRILLVMLVRVLRAYYIFESKIKFIFGLKVLSSFFSSM